MPGRVGVFVGKEGGRVGAVKHAFNALEGAMAMEGVRSAGLSQCGMGGLLLTRRCVCRNL